MVQKRPAATSAKGATKKARLDAIGQQCALVAGGLQEAADVAAVPPTVAEMLTSMLQESLAVPKDARHTFQESVADMVCDVLASAQLGMKKGLDDAQAAVDGGAQAKTQREAEVEGAGEKLAACQEELQAKKLALADAARAFKKGKEVVWDAQDAQLKAEAGVREAASKKSSLESALRDVVGPLAGGSVPEAEVAGMVAGLTSTLAELEVVDSLVSALPTALTKSPADRGPFDSMVVGQVNDEIGKKVSALEAEIGEGGTVSQERACALETAQTGFEGVKATQLAAADAFTGSREALEAAKQSLREAQQQLKDLLPEAKKCQRSLASAQATLEAFQTGALTAAKELKERLTPPPPKQEPVAEETPAVEELGTTEVVPSAAELAQPVAMSAA